MSRSRRTAGHTPFQLECSRNHRISIGGSRRSKKGFHEPGAKQESSCCPQEDTVFTYRCYNGREKPCRFRQTWAHFAAIHTEELNLPTVGPTTLQLHGFWSVPHWKQIGKIGKKGTSHMVSGLAELQGLELEYGEKWPGLYPETLSRTSFPGWSTHPVTS